MRTPISIGFAVVLSVALGAAKAQEAAAPAKSERAMTPDSAKAGASPNTKSERAMTPDSAEPGSAPSGKSERAMTPDKKAE